jgi:hypothetical protein
VFLVKLTFEDYVVTRFIHNEKPFIERHSCIMGKYGVRQQHSATLTYKSTVPVHRPGPIQQSKQQLRKS